MIILSFIFLFHSKAISRGSQAVKFMLAEKKIYTLNIQAQTSGKKFTHFICVYLCDDVVFFLFFFFYSVHFFTFNSNSLNTTRCHGWPRPCGLGRLRWLAWKCQIQDIVSNYSRSLFKAILVSEMKLKEILDSEGPNIIDGSILQEQQ